MSNYKSISNFGENVQNNSENPLNYCLVNNLNSLFMNGSTANTIGRAHGKNCQAFMSDYCSQNGWDDICEQSSQSDQLFLGLTAGDILIANTASKKYNSNKDENCITYEQFDPTVATSPFVSFWKGDCIPIYEVNPKTIDDDPVMNKILNKPMIAFGLLVNIYNNAVRNNTIDMLKGTKIYNFFQLNDFQDYIKLLNTPNQQFKKITNLNMYG